MSAGVSLAIGDRGLGWFAFAFAVTQLVEVPIYARALRSRTRSVRIAVAFGASALTHPLVWYVFPPLTMALLSLLSRRGLAFSLPVRTLLYGALAEGFAVLAEAAYLRAFAVRRPLAWSLLANTASVLAGTAIAWTLGALTPI